jgi:class 3 adenylate cyclase/tetratricopeptide (TPR) repeat protein
LSPEADSVAQRLQRLVPKEYAERLLATRGQVSKERRTVTILFSDVKGSTSMAEDLDPEDWTEIMEGAFEFLIEPVYRYEGTLVRLMGDAILAFFGAPIAHEDDAERAVRAALEITTQARGYAARMAKERGIEGFNVRVGIHTGLVVVGEVGSDLRVEYTAMGDVVNLAARMETAAEPGTVLITGDTHKLVAPLFETEALGSIAVKGKAEPVPAYRVLGARPATGKQRGIAGLESPMVGREAESYALRQAVERLQAGTGGIVTIVGDAGIGKSRLVAETLATVCEPTGSPEPSPGFSDLQWAEGRCLSYGSSMAYHLWLDLLRMLLGVKPKDTVVAVRAVLWDQVQGLCVEYPEDIYAYLARLMSLPLDEDQEAVLRGLEGEQLKVGTFHAVQTLVERAAAERPLALICEDLHWADPSSLELLGRLLPLTNRVPLLLLCLLRPETEHGCWRLRQTAAREHRQRHTDLWLQPLSTEESVSLVGNLLQVEGLPQRLRERILGIGEGNPFYVEEILRSLMDQGVIVRDGATGQWGVMRDVAHLTIPDTLHGVLVARIDRLQEEARHVLQTASVIGRIFLHRVLASLAPGEMELDPHLVTLRREEMIRERARFPEVEYIFKHELTRQAAYNGLLKKKRRVLHRQVAVALERLFPDRFEDQVGLLAHHWERAAEPGKAIETLMQAGELARRQYANEEAVDYFQRALALLRDAPPAVAGQRVAATAFESLGDVLELASRHDEARTAWENALACVSAEDRIGRGRLWRKTGESWSSQHQPESTGQALDQAETALGPEPAGAAPEWWQEWVAIQLTWTDVHYYRRDLGRMSELAERIQPVVQKHGKPHQRASFFGVLGQANNMRDRFIASDQTLAYSRAILEAAQESGSLARKARARFGLGFNLLWHGDLEGAKQNLQTALALSGRVGDRLLETQCLTYLAIVYRKSGQVARAREVAGQGLEAAAAMQNATYIAAARANLAWVAWREANLAGTLAHGRAALKLWQGPGLHGFPFKWLALYPLISASLAQDRLAEAIDHVRALLDPVQQALPEKLETVLEGALQAWNGGEPDAARAHLERAIDLAQDGGYL